MSLPKAENGKVLRVDKGSAEDCRRQGLRRGDTEVKRSVGLVGRGSMRPRGPHTGCPASREISTEPMRVVRGARQPDKGAKG